MNLTVKDIKITKKQIVYDPYNKKTYETGLSLTEDILISSIGKIYKNFSKLINAISKKLGIPKTRFKIEYDQNDSAYIFATVLVDEENNNIENYAHKKAKWELGCVRLYEASVTININTVLLKSVKLEHLGSYEPNVIEV